MLFVYLNRFVMMSYLSLLEDSIQLETVSEYLQMLCGSFISLVVLTLKLLALEQIREFILVLSSNQWQGILFSFHSRFYSFVTRLLNLFCFWHASEGLSLIKFLVTCSLELHACTKLVFLLVNCSNGRQFQLQHHGLIAILSRNRCYGLRPLMTALLSIAGFY